MKLIAKRFLTGDYGSVVAGQEFECSAEVGKHLINKGVAYSYEVPKVTYESKVVTPEASGVGAREPFRDGSVSDTEPAAVAPEGDQELPSPDVPPKRASNRGRRGKRQESSPAE